ncbi:MAG: hypothetical protein MJZ83_04735 [Bacteroidaceae bacterium]|nr:hypothetical protein [Bacteroidaceae bacterium]
MQRLLRGSQLFLLLFECKGSGCLWYLQIIRQEKSFYGGKKKKEGHQMIYPPSKILTIKKNMKKETKLQQKETNRKHKAKPYTNQSLFLIRPILLNEIHD